MPEVTIKECVAAYRAINDADFKISIDISLAEFRKLVFDQFLERRRISHCGCSFHMFSIWAIPEVAEDLLMSVFDYERQAVQSAIEIEIEGVVTRVCKAEDLIIHNVIAERSNISLTSKGFSCASAATWM